MKTAQRTMPSIAMTAAVAAMMFTAGGARAGDLTPPGAPGSTMKTLDQVEPRIPIPGGGSAYTIGASGSYYLTGNLLNTLTISADNVTVDLMGYTIDGPMGGEAINIPSDQDHLVIRNGILTGAGTGIDARYLRESNSRFENLTVSDCTFCGLYIGSGCRVENVLVRNCGSYGIQSSSAGKLEVRDCRVIGTNGDGIEADDGCVIVGNTIENGAGIGLQLDGTGSYVADNIVRGNADNYDLIAGNRLNLLLCEIPETLEWPCSVKLAGTLSTTQTGVDGITVAADDVTIDMGGHALVGPGADSGSGIHQSDEYRNLRVFNGKAVEWRGCYEAGIFAGGTGAILSDLQVTSNYFGIFTSFGSTLSGCVAQYNGDDGIYAYSGCTISDCVARYNDGDGILVNYDSRVAGCLCDGNDGTGIRAMGVDNRIEGNTCTDNDRGIAVDSYGNFIVKNTCSGNATNWEIVADNKVGVIVSAPNSGAISGSTGGAGVGSTDPWANFSF